MLVLQEATGPRSSNTRTHRFAPGATIGMLGSGQLGRMFTHAAQRLGYRVHVISTHPNSPTGQVADREVVVPYEDCGALATFADSVDVVTLEFENVPIEAVRTIQQRVPVYPAPAVLHTVQHRLREKQFLQDASVPCTPFWSVRNLAELREGLDSLDYPAILKTAVDGYDGKGQVRINSPADAEPAWQRLNTSQAILEGFIDFKCELSIIAARGADGSFATYGPLANAHVDHILDVTVLPCPELASISAAAIDAARTIVERLNVIGIVCVEFFLDRDGQLLVNEIAPRPHNSGHLTIDACVTSQFEQHVRAVCGLPLGSTAQMRPAAMANLLGQLWVNGEPDWAQVLAFSDVKLHLYGKPQARPGRKMGHLTALADTPAEAEQTVRAARAALGG